MAIAALAPAAVLAMLLLRPEAENQTEYGLFRPDDHELVRLGEELYGDHCAACHGAELEGETPDWQLRDEDGYLPGPPHDETGHTWHHADQLLFDITRYGVQQAADLPDYPSRMPAFGDVLEDEEIIAILSFIKSRWPDHIRQYQDDINRRLAEQRR
jgi:S-disulfanyl-L-cysteine oxidoreductase SoxD